MNNKLSFSTILGDIRIVLTIIGTIVAVTLFIVAPIYQINQDMSLIKKDIEVIRTNELVHLQDSINENSENIDLNRETNNKILQTITRIEVLLENLTKSGLD